MSSLEMLEELEVTDLDCLGSYWIFGSSDVLSVFSLVDSCWGWGDGATDRLNFLSLLSFPPAIRGGDSSGLIVVTRLPKLSHNRRPGKLILIWSFHCVIYVLFV